MTIGSKLPSDEPEDFLSKIKKPKSSPEKDEKIIQDLTTHQWRGRDVKLGVPADFFKDFKLPTHLQQGTTQAPSTGVKPAHSGVKPPSDVQKAPSKIETPKGESASVSHAEQPSAKPAETVEKEIDQQTMDKLTDAVKKDLTNRRKLAAIGKQPTHGQLKPPHISAQTWEHILDRARASLEATDLPYYHSDISRDGAKDLLTKMGPGDKVLLRKSSAPGEFFAITSRQDVSPTEAYVSQELVAYKPGSGWAILDSQPGEPIKYRNEKFFPKMDELIASYYGKDVQKVPPKT